METQSGHSLNNFSSKENPLSPIVGLLESINCTFNEVVLESLNGLNN